VQQLKTPLALLALVVLAWPLILGASPPPPKEGWATWYGHPYHGRRMANGQVFDMNDPTTTASNEFPLGTWLRVTNPANGVSIDVQVRDRGAFTHALDLSQAAFRQLTGGTGGGRLWVRYQVIPGPGAALPEEGGGEDVAQQSEAPPAEPPRVTAATSNRGGSRSPESVGGEHVVAPGETLGGIAVMYGLRTADLVTWNGLSNPNLVRAGQRIRLLPPAAPQEAAPSAAPANAVTYTVVPGDTLWGIAMKFGVTVADLAAWNGLGSVDLIRPGQQLQVGQQAAASEGQPQPAPASGGPVTYTTVAGDTLWGIAQRFGVSLQDLASANGLGEDDVLPVGRTLTIPGGDAPPSGASQPTEYVVQPGDTLSGIASRLGTTVEALVAANGLANPDLLSPGTTLIVP